MYLKDVKGKKIKNKNKRKSLSGGIRRDFVGLLGIMLRSERHGLAAKSGLNGEDPVKDPLLVYGLVLRGINRVEPVQEAARNSLVLKSESSFPAAERDYELAPLMVFI